MPTGCWSPAARRQMTVWEEEREEEADHRDRGDLGPKTEPRGGLAERQRSRHDDQRLDGVHAREEGDAEAQRHDGEHPPDDVARMPAHDKRADHRVRQRGHQYP